MLYIKTKLEIDFNDFLQEVSVVKEFKSTSGKRYQVSKYDGASLKVLRLDGRKPDMEWSINLSKLFEAYQKLSDFSTANFKSYVPRTHSPARGLLLKMGLIKLSL